MSDDREVLLQAAKFRVDRVRVPARSGGLIEREMITHGGSVVVLPVLPDGRVVFIRNRRFAIGRELLELPAGTLDAGEDPAVCARRELAEETGYRAQTVEPLIRFFPSPGFMSEEMHCFVARGLTPGPQALEEGEHIEVEPLAPAEVDALVDAGELVDGKTLVCWLLWRRGS